MKSNTNVTRGSGLLEGLLAKKRSAKANSLIKDFHRKGRILDIGCGSYPYFLMTVDFKEKYGVDPVLDMSKIKNGKIILKKLDVTEQKLPFADNNFDVITMLAVFEHIDGKKIIGVLREIRRTLKKGGVFVLTTPSPWADGLLHLMAKMSLISKEEIHEHKHNHQKSKVINILRDAGFKKGDVKSGFFEIYMNMWFVALK